MKLKKVISGGQDGADRTGLEEAKRLGLETGGHAPRYYLTDKGYDPSLANFGLVEDESITYPPRTRKNVLNSDATLWFGKMSPGFKCTLKYVDELGKPFWENPTEDEIRHIVRTYEVINIAGNRPKKNPQVIDQVKRAFRIIEEVKNAQ